MKSGKVDASPAASGATSGLTAQNSQTRGGGLSQGLHIQGVDPEVDQEALEGRQDLEVEDHRLAVNGIQEERGTRDRPLSGAGQTAERARAIVTATTALTDAAERRSTGTSSSEMSAQSLRPKTGKVRTPALHPRTHSNLSPHRPPSLGKNLHREKINEIHRGYDK